MTITSSISKITDSYRSFRYLNTIIGRDATRAWFAEMGQRGVATLTRGGDYAGKAAALDLVQAMPLTASIDDVIDWLDLGDVSAYRKEFQQIQADLADRYREIALPDPAIWAVENGTAELLYCIVRAHRPETMIETGIANGHSTYAILSAMAANGVGRLASLDVREDTGRLVTNELAQRWTHLTLTTLPPRYMDVYKLLRPFAPCDLFFHDGDHRFPGQILDYRIGADILTPTGILMSDDIDATTAWLTAARRDILPARRLAFADHRKIIGFARRDA